MNDITCIHAESGLCALCQADYDESPSDYIEFGDHPQGIANMRALEEEIAAEAVAEREADAAVARMPRRIPADDEIPF